jgi:hypothetical protein
MKDKERLNVLLYIINQAYEYEPTETQDRGRYYEGVMAAIYGVLKEGESE